jgi:hypothetical protein
LQLQTEAQAWKIQALINALQQSHFEAERRIVVLQKEHQDKLHVMLRHFAEESSGSSGTEAASRHLHLNSDVELGKYKRENKILKKRIQDLEALLNTDARGEQHKSLVYCYEILLASHSGYVLENHDTVLENSYLSAYFFNRLWNSLAILIKSRMKIVCSVSLKYISLNSSC